MNSIKGTIAWPFLFVLFLSMIGNAEARGRKELKIQMCKNSSQVLKVSGGKSKTAFGTKWKPYNPAKGGVSVAKGSGGNITIKTGNVFGTDKFPVIVAKKVKGGGTAYKRFTLVVEVLNYCDGNKGKDQIHLKLLRAINKLKAALLIGEKKDLGLPLSHAKQELGKTKKEGRITGKTPGSKDRSKQIKDLMDELKKLKKHLCNPEVNVKERIKKIIEQLEKLQKEIAKEQYPEYFPNRVVRPGRPVRIERPVRIDRIEYRPTEGEVIFINEYDEIDNYHEVDVQLACDRPVEFPTEIDFGREIIITN